MEWPPMSGPFQWRTFFAPASFAAQAAESPAIPVLTTRTSKTSVSAPGRRVRGAGDAGRFHAAPRPLPQEAPRGSPAGRPQNRDPCSCFLRGGRRAAPSTDPRRSSHR